MLDVGGHICDVCDYEAKNARGLNIHKGHKHQPKLKKFACKLCFPAKYFPSKSAMHAHKYNHHGRKRKKLTRLPAERIGYMSDIFFSKQPDELMVGAIVAHKPPRNNNPLSTIVAYKVKIVPLEILQIFPED